MMGQIPLIYLTDHLEKTLFKETQAGNYTFWYGGERGREGREGGREEGGREGGWCAMMWSYLTDHLEETLFKETQAGNYTFC